MDKEEVIAAIVLKEYERKKRLNRIINDSALDHYFSNAYRTISTLIFIVLAPALMIVYIPPPFSLIYIFMIILFAENRRQRERISALVELIKIEKKEKYEPIASGNPEPPSCNGA